MSAFFKPARSLQRPFVYKRPQAQLPICSLQRRSLGTSSPGACAEKPARLMGRHPSERIINHPSAVIDFSKIPLGYAFVPSDDVAITQICRRMASRRPKRAIFACVSTQMPERQIDSHGQPPKSTKAGQPPVFGIYVPSDIADAATIEFQEQSKAFKNKRNVYISEWYPHMPYMHRNRLNAKEHKGLQLRKGSFKMSFKRSFKKAKWTFEWKIEKYIRKSLRKEGSKLTDEEVKWVMRSWKDGSKMPDVELFNVD